MPRSVPPLPPLRPLAPRRSTWCTAAGTAALALASLAGCGGQAGSDATDRKAATPAKAAVHTGDAAEAERPAKPEQAPAAAAPRTFKKGDRALQGLIADDVPAYNKAQGDPIDGLFSLAQAFEGDAALADAAGGKLHAVLHTSKGKITCELFETQTPATVASFVGLARGTRPYLDPKTKEWTTGKFFDGVLFHRVIDDFMIQTGDPTGTGRGGPGFFVPDEFDPKLRHNKAGILSMANRNRVDPATQKLRVDPASGKPLGNTGSSQFFVTVRPTEQLDDRHTVFGQCDTKVAETISKVEVRTNQALGEDHKPVEDVRIEKVEFERRK
jgi:cyclophilin family peptidyl-prolyl cis-trans isomerase